jgi:hypothetical protein
MGLKIKGISLDTIDECRAKVFEREIEQRESGSSSRLGAALLKPDKPAKPSIIQCQEKLQEHVNRLESKIED